MARPAICVVLIVALAHGALAIERENEYCKIPCKYDKIGGVGDHVMCVHPDPVPAAACKNYESRAELHEDHKTDILKLHNMLRKLLSEGRVPGFPKALNMRLLRWDFELEQIAKHHVLMCTGEFPVCYTSRDGERNDVSQDGKSVLSIGFQEDLYLTWIQDWFLKYRNISEPIAEQVAGLTIATRDVSGQFVTLAWAETERIGCAQSRFFALLEGDTVNEPREVTQFTCLYGPRGSILGKPIYEFDGLFERSQGIASHSIGLSLLAAGLWLLVSLQLLLR